MTHPSNLQLPAPVNERDHVIGPQGAPVTVVKYGDYECPDCHKMHRAIEKMTRELLNDVRLVYRHFPLVKVHPNALRAAEAAEAAAAQGKFWEMHTLLFRYPDKLGAKDLRKHATDIGLDLVKYDNEMASGVHAQEILKSRNFSISRGITGTPTFFVNDEMWAMSGINLIDAVTALVRQRAV